MSSGDRLSIALIYPTVLGLYGDRGNAAVLAHRANARDIETDVLVIDPDRAVPKTADIYLIGGGEDIAQTTGCELLREDGGLELAHRGGAVIFAVCAGMQILGQSFPADGRIVEGLGLLDIVTVPGSPRAVGELLCDPVDPALGTLTGYENHGGRTHLGPAATLLGRVVHGVGNGDGHGTEGVVQDRVIGTYLHGPALVRNPSLADLLLCWAIGRELPPMEEPVVEALRTERISAVRSLR
jgi:lipid II isoglutaminyl synthase (glutamine-hydrolysing)